MMNQMLALDRSLMRAEDMKNQVDRQWSFPDFSAVPAGARLAVGR
jgi:hypothetical protein